MTVKKSLAGIAVLLALAAWGTACTSAFQNGVTTTTPAPTRIIGTATPSPPVLPRDTPIASMPTSTLAPGMPDGPIASVKGPVWQVTVLSVVRMKRLRCGSDSTHWANENYEILEVVAEFSPIIRSEKMPVSSEDAALLDRAGNIHKALGGGKPSEPATLGRESDSCGVGGGGRVVVSTSYLIEDTLTMSFFFGVEEGTKGYSFQFMDYPPIPLNE